VSSAHKIEKNRLVEARCRRSGIGTDGNKLSKSTSTGTSKRLGEGIVGEIESILFADISVPLG
jgi:hypothetical protein